LDLPLRALIESARGLIEDQDVGLPDDSSGNCDSLLLSTGELSSLDAAFDLETGAKILNVLEVLSPLIHISLARDEFPLKFFLLDEVLQFLDNNIEILLACNRNDFLLAL
jgi:hypothetical protein